MERSEQGLRFDPREARGRRGPEAKGFFRADVPHRVAAQERPLQRAQIVRNAGLHVAGASLLKDSFWGVHFYAFFAPALLVAATALLLAASLFIVFKSQATGIM